MKRRGFLKSLAGMFAASAVPTGAWASAGKWMVGGAVPMAAPSTAFGPLAASMRATKEMVGARVFNNSFNEALRPGLEKVFGAEYANIPDESVFR